MVHFKVIMKILICGSSGQLGTELIRILQGKKFEFFGFNSKEMDLSQFENVRRLIVSIKPNIIVNCAAWTNVELAESNEKDANLCNFLGVVNLATIAKEINSRFFTISTDYVFDGVSETPWKITDKANPKNAYGRSKYKGEKGALEIYPIGTTVIRTAWLYSPWRKNFAKSVIRLAIINQKSLKIVDDQFGQPTLARDLAKFIVSLIEAECKPGILHATNSGSTSWYNFAKQIFLEIGQDPDRIFPISTAQFESKVERPLYSVLENTNNQDYSIKQLRNWREALTESVSEILFEVEKEL